MIQTLKLLFPALIPSWRFFDWIAPSPRIEVKSNNEWQEFRPRPDHVSFSTMVKRMIWNPHWNETLFLISCAERLAEDPSDQHSYDQILNRIIAGIDNQKVSFVQFRLAFIHRKGNALKKDIRYISKIHDQNGKEL
jgi:hypothetical protein